VPCNGRAVLWSGLGAWAVRRSVVVLAPNYSSKRTPEKRAPLNSSVMRHKGGIMKIVVAFVLACLLPLSANAATKDIDCTQTDSQGKVLYVHATISDSSDEAEVQTYMAGAPCAQDKSCSTGVYKKEVLPTVMRLTQLQVGDIASSYIIDINRSNLSDVTRSTIRLFDKVTDDTFTGTCTVKVDESKSIL
jgi:hypothetical protein